mmetsp:Transcript_58979/g.183120  ORF Transcript_58979/g.183120 Transcript_58979/m.183120 type:complete len:140 (+) Transcript_58979:802-1221(+)
MVVGWVVDVVVRVRVVEVWVRVVVTTVVVMVVDVVVVVVVVEEVVVVEVEVAGAAAGMMMTTVASAANSSKLSSMITVVQEVATMWEAARTPSFCGSGEPVRGVLLSGSGGRMADEILVLAIESVSSPGGEDACGGRKS